MRQFFFFFAAFFGSLQLNAQSYYPGGMGNSNLILWLNANVLSSMSRSGTNLVGQWNDLSGNGRNFISSGGIRPTYGATASPSGRPALTFVSTNQNAMYITSLPSSISFTNGVSAFAVASYDHPQTTYGWQRIFDFGNGQASDNFMMGRYGSTTNAYYEGWNGNSGDQTYTTVNTITDGVTDLFEAIQTGGTAGTLTNVSHYRSGASQSASGQAGSSKAYLPKAITRTSNFIGRSNWSLDNYFSGTMSEILLYNSALDTTQRIILENYVSAEWNETVSVTKYTPPTTTTYGTNLVGIGYTSSTDNFLTDVAGSTDGLGFSSGTTASDFLQSAGYAMAAHNAQTNTAISNATIPGISTGSPLTRWNRSWNMQLTGGNSSGSITVNFNFSDYNGSTPSATSYALLYNATDGTFASGTNKLIASTSTASGNTVSFTTQASKLATGYYTIVYSSTPFTLPVTLETFTATKQGSNNLLEWSTSAQVNFSRFDVQRSEDGAHFATIGTVAAAYGQDGGQYSFIDNSPLSGMNYYRLAMADLDGKVAYSGIRTVNQDASSTGVTLNLYPNPTANRVHLAFANISGTMNIRLIDTRGQVMHTMTVASASTDIPVDNLTRGIYFVEVSAINVHVVKSFMKN